MSAELRAYARTAALREGVEPEKFVRQIQQESGFNPDAHNAGSGADGIAQIVVRHHPTMAGKTRDPHASLDYAAALMRSHLEFWRGRGATGRALDGLALSSYNAGRQATITGLAGNLDGWPFGETVRYLAAILPTTEANARTILTTGEIAVVGFDPQEPAHPQEDDFDCSQEALEWALWSLGRKPQENWLEPTMLAEGVMSTRDGLLDASGAGLAAFVVRHYGEDGFQASHAPSVSFDDVAAEAGRYPLLIGARRWGPAGHWSGVRGYDAGRGLLLANPAEGYAGVGQVLSRDQFAALGPWSMVRVTHPDLGAKPVANPPADPDELVQARARIADLEAERATLISTLGYLTGDLAGALQAAVNTLRRHGAAA